MFFERLNRSKYGYISLFLSLMVVFLIWGGMGIVKALGIWGCAPLWVEHLWLITYLGGWVAVALAALGLAKDSQRLVAGLALLFGIFSQLFCSIPVAVLR